MASFKDYQARWLPLQDHFAQLVTDMVKPDSWQKQEAEGKGNVDVAQEFAKMNQQRNASQIASGINVGSTKFKMGVAASASAEAEARGMAINTGNEAIDKAHLANLTAIARTGQSLATTATQGQGAAGEVASRIAISGAQEANETRAGNYELAGFGIGALGSAGAMKQMGAFGREQMGINPAPITDMSTPAGIGPAPAPTEGQTWA
jgi:hypothetical protein